MTQNQEAVICTIKHVIYESTRNNYKIIKCAVKSKEGIIQGKYIVKGNITAKEVGEEFEAVGEWTQDPKYGLEFEVATCTERIPINADSIVKYLSNRNIKGIGPATAQSIVEMFGEDTMEVIMKTPERLLKVPKIGEKKLEKIKESMREQNGINEIMVFLQGVGISPAYARKIYLKYKEASVSKLKENPYILAEEIDGIGFLTADRIAKKLGIKKDSKLRIESGVKYALKEMNNLGHVFGYIDELKERGGKLLDIEEEVIEGAVYELAEEEKLIREDMAVYDPKTYFAEKNTAFGLIRVLTGKPKKKIKKITEKEIDQISKETGMEYAEEQKMAIKTASESKVMVLTGGPGTGKTTTVNGIIKMFENNGLTVRCAAPTGKAAKRMSETTGIHATTIHVLLEARGTFKFNRNLDNPIEGDVLIIDESSMLDIFLTNALTKAMPDSMRLILVGDVDQLPSIGCGNVLNDIIGSGVVPVVRLEKIFRQAQSSRIVQNAHLINKGMMPTLVNPEGTDFFFIRTDDMFQEEIRDAIVKYTCENLPRYYNISQEDIQILSPMKKGRTGVNELNLYMQMKLNPEKPGEEYIQNNDIIIRAGDRVMQTRNNYDKNIFNGDVGYVKRIYETEDDGKVTEIDFGGNIVKLDIYEASDLVLAYAMTIHKSQGSEYSIVVMPLTMSNFIMLQRNLLYTGVTRAKKVFVLFGERRAVKYAVDNYVAPNRNTKLKERLLESAKEKGVLEAA